MTTHSTPSARHFTAARDGTILIKSAFALTMVLGLSGLAIDGGYLYFVRAQLQATADAAALAAAFDLPDPVVAKAKAQAYVEKNMPAAKHGSVVGTNDVQVGNWNAATKTFTVGAPYSAVRVIARRASSNGNAVDLFFMRALGISTSNVVADAIAAKGGTCYDNGIIAGNKVEAGSNETVTGDFCMYGRNGVKIGSNNSFSSGAKIGMLNDTNFEQGSDNTGAVVEEADMQPELANKTNQLIDGVIADFPSYIVSVQTVSSLPGTLAPGVAYIVNGDATINSGQTLSNNVVIVNDSSKVLSVGSNVNMSNVLLLSRFRIQMGSDLHVGPADFCTTGAGTVSIVANENVIVGSTTYFHGAQILAGNMVDMGSNNVSPDAVVIQAGTDVKLGSNLTFGNCAKVSGLGSSGAAATVLLQKNALVD
jgi:Flp pilus assembly protein TadG